MFLRSYIRGRNVRNLGKNLLNLAMDPIITCRLRTGTPVITLPLKPISTRGSDLSHENQNEMKNLMTLVLAMMLPMFFMACEDNLEQSLSRGEILDAFTTNFFDASSKVDFSDIPYEDQTYFLDGGDNLRSTIIDKILANEENTELIYQLEKALQEVRNLKDSPGTIDYIVNEISNSRKVNNRTPSSALRSTPCFNSYEIAVDAIIVEMYACAGTAIGTGQSYAAVGCVAYALWQESLARREYENCIESNYYTPHEEVWEK